MRGAAVHDDARSGLRHLAYAAGWKKFEPCWDLVIRAKHAGMMLPLLETILSEFGKRAPGGIDRRDRMGSTPDVGEHNFRETTSPELLQIQRLPLH